MNGRTVELRNAVEAALAARDRPTAVRVAVEAVSGRRVAVAELYRDVLHPILVDVGARWQAGERRVWEEHLAAAIVADHIAAADAVIATAAVPGRPAPRLVDAATVARMKPGAVVVDLAADTGGNCELTRPGETVDHGGVLIHGPLNVPAMLPVHASDQYARNLFNFISPFVKDGELVLDWEDEVLAGSVLTRDGAIVNEAVRAALEGAGRAGAPPAGPSSAPSGGGPS